jgi:hypothetical protein
MIPPAPPLVSPMNLITQDRYYTGPCIFRESKFLKRVVIAKIAAEYYVIADEVKWFSGGGRAFPLISARRSEVEREYAPAVLSPRSLRDQCDGCRECDFSRCASAPQNVPHSSSIVHGELPPCTLSCVHAMRIYPAPGVHKSVPETVQMVQLGS